MDRKTLHKWLIENEAILIDQKKAAIKRGDSIPFTLTTLDLTQKAEIDVNAEVITVKAVMNTTNLLDTHKDVHLPGIWNKTLQERAGRFIMLQEHDMSFKSIIAKKEDLKVITKRLTWMELGLPYTGKCEALIFTAKVRLSRNPFMFDLYKNNEVDNHSVGMSYVKLSLCIDDENETDYFENWNKYYPKIINKEVADELGYFWAIHEAKLLEGSAVPLGSNFATPTLSVKEPSSQPLMSAGNNDAQKFHDALNFIKDEY